MIVIMSLWRNDAQRQLDARVQHLLSKTSATHAVAWLWIVGDSGDDTESLLRARVAGNEQVAVIRYDSGVIGEDVQSRRLRLAATASRLFAEIPMQADYACLHESDLESPENVADLLMGPEPTAAWPVIPLDPPRFYDIWAFKDVDGRSFDAFRTRPALPFQVSSFGSCWMAEASMIRDRVLGVDCVVDLCRQWRAEGRRLLVDPRVTVVQPVSLWSAA